ncbi:MAG: hypothetical protein ACXVRP_07465, partial [Solirubrobacteraceae bacterium]
MIVGPPRRRPGRAGRGGLELYLSLPGQLRHRPQPHHRRRHDDERDAARVRQAQFRFTFSPAPPKLRPTRRE